MAVNHGDGTSPLLQATTEFQGKGSKVKVGAGGRGGIRDLDQLPKLVS